ncbi:hypothetical protein MPSEU_000911000 [Mayamaea pseudoterrestris]|nr:hypothetical protein MPSEU_000911000 [Mayamaea pseudoterrestris]
MRLVHSQALTKRTSHYALTVSLIIVTLLSSNRLAVAAISSNETDQQAQHRTPQQQQQHSCGLYLAPSTIPGAGLGMFNGRSSKSLWEPIGPADLVIPVTDYSEHNSVQSHNDDEDEQAYIMNYYGWNIPSFAHLQHDANVDDTVAFCPGPGAALNCLMGLVNTVALDEEVSFKTYTNQHSSTPPHAGSFTPFSNRQLVSKVNNIEPGAELFDDYGEAYFRVKERPAYHSIPVTSDYSDADSLLEEYESLRKQVCGDGLCHEPMRAADPITTVSSPTSSLHSSLYQLMNSLKSTWPSPVLNALPENPETVDQLTAQGTAMRDYHRSIRSIAWLEEHGDCMDKIRIDESGIPNAGNGAFATTFIAKGDIVGPAPALHIPRDFMQMYPVDFDENEQEYNVNAKTNDGPTHQQLLLNYCFGHDRSSLLLCPYGAATQAINHDAIAPNAEVVWNYKLMQRPEWLELPLPEWTHHMSAGLVLSYVATRDIQADEEVTIDYGRDWQKAWDEHVGSFEPPVDRADYLDALALNEQELELQVSPFWYSDKYVQLKCRGMYLRWNTGTVIDHGDIDDDEEEETPFSYTTETDKKTFSCRPLHRYASKNTSDTLYVVQVYARYGEDGQCFESDWEVVFGMPRDALVFEDRMYSRDHAQPWSFRHSIGIPDEIMPEAWLDLDASVKI